MGEMGDRNRTVFAEAYKAVGLDFTLEEQGMHYGYRARTQGSSGSSEEAAAGTTSQRKLRPRSNIPSYFESLGRTTPTGC